MGVKPIPPSYADGVHHYTTFPSFGGKDVIPSSISASTR